MSVEVKMAENPEGLHIDIEDLIAHLEQEADDRELNVRGGLYNGQQVQFFRGEIYGYRRVAEQFKKVLNNVEG